MPGTRKKTAKKRTQKGKGVVKTAKSVISFIRKHKLLSKVADVSGRPKLAKVISMTGFGKKKRATRKKAPSRRGPVTILAAGPRIRMPRVQRAVPLGDGLRTSSRRTQRGRGIVGKIAGGLMSTLFPW